MSNIHMYIKDEYVALRTEMENNRRYIFERPLIIVIAILASIKLDRLFLSTFLSPLAIFLFLFNLWFTTNRLKFNARIAAYIQTILESLPEKNWIGWETFLGKERLWIQNNPKKYKEVIKDRVDYNTAPKSFSYYTVLYYFHLSLTFAALMTSVVIVCNDGSLFNFISFVLSFLFFICFISYAINARPKKIKFLIEEYRILHEYIYDVMQEP